MHNSKKSERGQALILIVFGIIVLVSITALAVDGGMAFSDRRNAQNAADSAALAGALSKVRQEAQWQSKALSAAATNGYNNDGTTNTVAVYNPPISGPYAVSRPGDPNTNYIQVVITSNVDMAFAPTIGVDQTTNIVQAVVRAKPGVQGSLYEGNAIVTLKPTNANSLVLSGVAKIKTINSGIFINSKDSCAVNVNGNITIQADTGLKIGGGTACKKGPAILPPVSTVPQWPYPPEYDIRPPAITCPSNNGTKTNTGNNKWTLTPGRWNGSNIPNNGDVTFSPGIYCINGDTHFNAQVKLHMHDVTLYLQNGSFTFNGGASLKDCNNLLVYAAPNAGAFKFNGNGDLVCTNVLFYIDSNSAASGIDITGTANIYLTAKQSGPYKNLLLYIPYSNFPYPPGTQAPVRLSGTSDTYFQGTILMPSRSVELSGNNSSSSVNSQIIVYTLSGSGTPNLTVDFKAEQNVNKPQPPVIELAE